MELAENNFNEKCGVVGVFLNHGNNASKLTYYSLWALQHRGQESSGITSATKKDFFHHAGIGLVAHAYDEKDLKKLKGQIAIGHNRYSTSGASNLKHAQPIYKNDNELSLAHNGNIPDTKYLKQTLKSAGITYYDLNDSELLHKVIRYKYVKSKNMIESISSTLQNVKGVYSIVVMNKNSLVAARDPYGIRPLSIGKLENGYVIASETCVFETIGAKFIRDVKPGEIVEIKDGKLASYIFAKPNLKIDIFEYIYFARPDSVIEGVSVYEARKKMGEYLATENKDIKADIVIPIPDSSVPASIGYSNKSKTPFEMALVKNRYIHRTFIKPTQQDRENSVTLKLNPIAQAIKGKHVVLVDDSIVRGTTSKKIIEMVRKYGAKKVSFLVSSPPVKYPDFYGINTPSSKELISANYTIGETQKIIGADNLRFLSFDGLIKAIGLKVSNLNTSCLTGIYPVPIPALASKKVRVDKHLH